MSRRTQYVIVGQTRVTVTSYNTSATPGRYVLRVDGEHAALLRRDTTKARSREWVVLNGAGEPVHEGFGSMAMAMEWVGEREIGLRALVPDRVRTPS